MRARKKTLAERFWPKVIVRGPDECWGWAGSVHRYGYGMIFDGVAMPVPAHRVSWQLAHGPVPPGLEILHACDNPPCCNPAHLTVGTHKQNMHDAKAKGRMARGERNGCARLTEDQVREIRSRKSRGAKDSALAAEYGLCRQTVNDIVRRRRWAWLLS